MLCLLDFEEHAEKTLDYRSWNFFSQGSGAEVTLRENLVCYERYAIIPRMLRNSATRDMSVTLLGDRVSFPVAIAPTAYQKLAHPDGEMAAARAAAAAGTLYTLSTVSTTSLEEVATCRLPGGPQWMQIYVLRDRTGTLDLVRRAEACGYRALVLTVDTPVIGLQLRMKRCGLELPPHLSPVNIAEYMQTIRSKSDSNHLENVDTLESRLCWDDVAWLKRVTKLPIVLKGIITAHDARQAVEYGASAVWISNHGGRQLDGTISAIDALLDIKVALEGTNCEIYVDGGIRWGTDVFKAIALGARAVFIGRPTIWGLAHSGKDGVKSVLDILRSELDKAMHLAGCQSLSDIGSHMVKRHHFSRL